MVLAAEVASALFGAVAHAVQQKKATRHDRIEPERKPVAALAVNGIRGVRPKQGHASRGSSTCYARAMRGLALAMVVLGLGCRPPGALAVDASLPHDAGPARDAGLGASRAEAILPFVAPPPPPVGGPVPAIEPLASSTFDPSECARAHLAQVSEANTGIDVLGPEGARCRFVVARLGARPRRYDVAQCTAPRTGPVMNVSWDPGQLEVLNATCTVALDVPPEAYAALLPATVEDALWRLVADAGSVDVTPNATVRLRVRLWPAFEHRPDLASLDSSALEPKRLVIRRSQWPEPVASIVRSPMPRRVRFSVPTWNAGIFASDAGRYVAGELELESVDEARVRGPQDPLTVDVGACEPGEGESVSFGLGSGSVTVKAATQTTCILTVTMEMEGGYQVHECTLARSRGTLTVQFPALPDELTSNCLTQQSGNSLMEMGLIDHVKIPGTQTWLDLEPREESPRSVPVGTRVALSLTVHRSAGKPSAAYEPVGAPLVKDRLVALNPGDGSHGRALDAALRHSRLRQGSTFRYVIPAESAGAFAKLVAPATLLVGEWLVVTVKVR
jgi:hypothetical protein